MELDIQQLEIHGQRFILLEDEMVQIVSIRSIHEAVNGGNPVNKAMEME